MDKLLICDMDGTLFNTLSANYHAYAQAVKEYGFSLSYHFYENYCNGKDYRDFLPEIIGDNAEELLENIHQRKIQLYSAYLDEVKENTMLFTMLETLKKNFFIALVTTASRDNCVQLLNCFHRKQFFDLIVTKEDVKYLKPNPEGFLIAMNFFHIEPWNTAVFEDSEDGIEAARRCGLSVYRVSL